MGVVGGVGGFVFGRVVGEDTADYIAVEFVFEEGLLLVEVIDVVVFELQFLDFSWIYYTMKFWLGYSLKLWLTG